MTCVSGIHGEGHLALPPSLNAMELAVKSGSYSDEVRGTVPREQGLKSARQLVHPREQPAHMSVLGGGGRRGLPSTCLWATPSGASIPGRVYWGSVTGHSGPPGLFWPQVCSWRWAVSGTGHPGALAPMHTSGRRPRPWSWNRLLWAEHSSSLFLWPRGRSQGWEPPSTSYDPLDSCPLCCPPTPTPGFCRKE